jgi:hypothetical protein
MPTGPRYERDFYAWTRYQAKVLSALETDDPHFDRDHVTEEIESLGIMERAAVRAQVRQVLKGFLCLMHSPGDRAKYRWLGEIVDARQILADKISPSLRRDVRGRLPCFTGPQGRSRNLACSHKANSWPHLCCRKHARLRSRTSFVTTGIRNRWRP